MTLSTKNVKCDYKLELTGSLLVAKKDGVYLTLSELMDLKELIEETITTMTRNRWDGSSKVVCEYYKELAMQRLQATNNIFCNRIYDQDFSSRHSKAMGRSNLVYIISILDNPQLGLKIGKTKNIQERMLAYRNTYQSPVVLHCVFIGDEAKELETELLNAYADVSLGNEWFNLSFQDLIGILAKIPYRKV